jgi:type IV secretory pathway ATPase VirB11/archaellum biosynthesis ATPase
MSDPTLLDLVANGTLDAEIAATLWSIAAERRSFMTVAVPRFAGKSTVSAGVLKFASPDTPIHILSGEKDQMDELAGRPDGGYLVVGEFSRAPVNTYIWGARVRKVFETVAAGFSLVTALHAPTVEEAYNKICSGNGVSDEDASVIRYMVYIERHGKSEEDFWRRISAVWEVENVVGGVPVTRLLHRWDEDTDTFEVVNPAQLLDADAELIQIRVGRIKSLVGSGQTSAADIEALIAG